MCGTIYPYLDHLSPFFSQYIAAIINFSFLFNIENDSMGPGSMRYTQRANFGKGVRGTIGNGKISCSSTTSAIFSQNKVEFKVRIVMRAERRLIYDSCDLLEEKKEGVTQLGIIPGTTITQHLLCIETSNYSKRLKPRCRTFHSAWNVRNPPV